MSIPEGYKANFNTLLSAATRGRLAVVECRDRVSGKLVQVVCATNYVDGEYEMVPLAKLFDGNPYDEVEPRQAEREFYTIQETDVGRPNIRAFGRMCAIQGVMGRIMIRDVGKRIYQTWDNAHHTQILEVESREQFEKRQAGEQ